MARIYTRTGDEGETGLFGGGRVRKDNLRVAAYGTIDELNAILGVARASFPNQAAQGGGLEEFIVRVQHQLFNVGAELATSEPALHGTNLLSDFEIAWLEQSIDGWEARLEPLRVFILPGGSAPAAHFHWARTVCRRAERLIVQLAANELIRAEVIRYINRLSDALFVAARAANAELGVADVAWDQRCEPGQSSPPN